MNKTDKNENTYNATEIVKKIEKGLDVRSDPANMDYLLSLVSELGGNKELASSYVSDCEKYDSSHHSLARITMYLNSLLLLKINQKL